MLHLFHGLVFPHPDDVADAFAFDIVDCAPTSDKFADYTFVQRRSKLQRFLLRLGLKLHRTNNGPESFHRHFCCQFISPHPTFHIFWDAFVRQQTVTYVIMNELTAGIAAPITLTAVEQKRTRRLIHCME